MNLLSPPAWWLRCASVNYFRFKTSEEARFRKQQNIYFYTFDTNMIHLLDRDLMHS